jgi:hypothetical protein
VNAMDTKNSYRSFEYTLLYVGVWVSAPAYKTRATPLRHVRKTTCKTSEMLVSVSSNFSNHFANNVEHDFVKDTEDDVLLWVKATGI